MAIALGTIYAGVRLSLAGLAADSAKAQAMIGGVATEADGLAASTAMAGKACLIGFGVIGVAAVGVGIATTKMAANYQSSLTTLQTGAGELQKNMGMVSNGLLNMAVATATPTKDLVAGMFTIESAGYRAGDGLAVMQAAAEGAKVGDADLTGMTDVLTTSLHNYGLQSSAAVPVVNSFIATVKNGKMVMDDLNQSLTNVLPTASKAGVSITDVEGALATMAESGDKGAAAGTHLSQMFMSLQNPSKKASDVLADLGLTTQGIADSMKKSLPDTLQMIYDKLSKQFPVGSAAFNAAAATIVGGSKQVKAWNELTGVSMGDLVGNTQKITDAYTKSGKSVTGWGQVQDTLNFKLDRAKEVAETLGIKMGTALLPVVGHLADGFSNNLVPSLIKFVDFVQHNVPLVAGIISGPLVVAGYLAATALWAMITPIIVAAAPFVAAAAAISLAVIGIKELYDHCEPFRKAISTIVDLFKTEFLSIFNEVKKAFTDAKPALKDLEDAFGKLITALKPVIELLAKIVGAFMSANWAVAIGIVVGLIHGLVGAFKGIIEVLTGVAHFVAGFVQFFVDLFTGHFNKLGNDLKTMWSGIVGIFKGAFDLIWGFVSNFVEGVINFFKDLWDKLTKHSIIPDMINDIVTWFEGLPGKVFTFIENLVTGAISRFNDMKQQAITKASELISGFATSISNGVGGVLGAIGGVKDSILQKLVDADQWLVDTGKKLIEGLVNGIKNAAGGAVNEVKNVGSGILGGIKSVFGIKSPSTVFAEVGDNLMQGLAVGVNRTSGAAVNSVANAGGAMIGAMQGTSASLGLNGAQLASQGIAAKGGNVINVTVQVTPDQNDSDTPEVVGQKFGVSFGTQLATTLAAKGY
jgi:TP901 family phage tail tape measure protein